MELDHIAYIDIVQICAVILALGKPLAWALCTAPPALPPSCTERGGAGTDTAALFNKHFGGHRCPVKKKNHRTATGQLSKLVLNYSHLSAQ